MSRAGKWVLGSCLGMGALLGLAVVLLHRKATVAIHEHEVTVASLLSEFQLNTPPRPPIFGAPLSGRGWDLYVQAAALIGSMENRERRAFPEMGFAAGEPDDEDIAPVWTQYAPAVDLVRRAVRSTDQSHDPARSAKIDSRELEELTGFLGGGAAYLHRRGQHREAFDLLTLYIVVCRDTLGRNDGGCGWSPESDREAGMTGLRFLADHALSAEALEEIAVRLDLLDAVRPSTAREYRLRDAFERRHALEGRLLGWDKQYSLEAGWKHLFLPSVAKASALREIEDSYRTYGDLERRTPIEREEAAKGLGPPWRNGQAPGTCIIPTNNLYFSEVTALEALSLLRVGIALAWYQVEHDTLPERLEDLVPRYLGKVPPQFSEQWPWHYSADTSTLQGIHRREWEIRRRGD